MELEGGEEEVRQVKGRRKENVRSEEATAAEPHPIKLCSRTFSF